MSRFLIYKVVFTVAMVALLFGATGCDDLDDEQVLECRPSIFEAGVTICEEVDY